MSRLAACLQRGFVSAPSQVIEGPPEACTKEAIACYRDSVSRLRLEACGWDPLTLSPGPMSSVPRYSILEIGIHREKIDDWRPVTAPAKRQSRCCHPAETLQSGGNGRARSIGCLLCPPRWRSMWNARSRAVDARKGHLWRAISTSERPQRSQDDIWDPIPRAKQLGMTLRAFRSWMRLMRVVAEFAKRHSLLDRVHIFLKAFEEAASLVNQRKTSQHNIQDIESRLRLRLGLQPERPQHMGFCSFGGPPA